MDNDLSGTILLLAYYLIVVAMLPILLSSCLKVPNEYARKLHHIFYSLSVFLLLELFSSWYIAVSAALLLAVLGYPLLLIIEKTAFYKKHFVDRTKEGGELRKQLIYVQLSFAVLFFFFWGVIGSEWKFVLAVAVMVWGFGDAAAALVGKKWGRSRQMPRFIEEAKTYEGTAAMIFAAGLAAFFTLILYAGIAWLPSIIISLIIAPASGIIELLSRKGFDTLTVPFLTAALTYPLIWLVFFWGWN